MITVTPHPEGCLLAVRAQPGARKNAVIGELAGALKVTVTTPPEDGRANKAIAELLREWLGLKRCQVEIASGLANRNKQFLIRGIDVGELAGMIGRKLPAA